MGEGSLPEAFTSIRWENEYTAVADISEEASVAVGDEFTIPTREVPVETWLDRFRIRINKLFTPPNEYHNIPLEKDTVRAKTTAVSESGRECALEMVVTCKYYGNRSLADLIR